MKRLVLIEGHLTHAFSFHFKGRSLGAFVNALYIKQKSNQRRDDVGGEMDIYGIGDSVLGFLQGHLHGSRRTGRTELMLNMLNKGDYVVCGTQAEQRHISHEIKARGVDGVVVLACDPVRLEGLVTRGQRANKVYFTHDFVEQFYECRINRMHEDLDAISARLIRRPERPEPPEPPSIRIVSDRFF